MTPEALRAAKIAEAWRLSDGTVADTMDHLADLYETNWTPPEPVDPDLLAAREWLKGEGCHPDNVDAGLADRVGCIRAYLAGCTRGREGAKGREADSRGVWAKLTQEQVDRAETAEAQRDAALEALRPFANAYAVLKRRGYLVAPNGTALMYDPQNPKFLGPFVDDLARAHRVCEGSTHSDYL